MKNVIIITGPTASGKTNIAIKLAKEKNGEIISCDSMQIYKGMDIGTATPLKKEQQGIKHHNFNIVEPQNDYSVASFKKNTLKVIDDIHSRKKLPIIVGGTGLYIDALIYNIEFKEQENNSITREKYEKIYQKKGKDYLYKLLLEKDKTIKNTIHKNSVKRVIRALEILERENKTLSEYKKNAIKKNSKYTFHIVVLLPDRKLVYESIESRIDLMIKQGLINEVKKIYSNIANKSAISLQAIGYKEVIWYLKGYITYIEMVRLLKRNTRRYAKRQFTWFKRYEQAIKINYDKSTNKEDILNSIIDHLDISLNV